MIMLHKTRNFLKPSVLKIEFNINKIKIKNQYVIQFLLVNTLLIISLHILICQYNTKGLPTKG